MRTKSEQVALWLFVAVCIVTFMAVLSRSLSLPSFRLVSVWKAHAGQVTALAFSADGRWLVTASSDWNVAKVWSVPNAQRRIIVLAGIKPARAPKVLSVAIAPDGQVVALGDDGGFLWLSRLHEASPSNPTKLRLPSPPASLAFSPDGAYLAALISAKKVLVHRLADGRRVAVLPFQRAGSSWLGGQVTFSLQGNALAAVNGSEAVIWKVRDWSCLARFPVAGRTIAIDPQGNCLITTDGSLVCWQPSRGDASVHPTPSRFPRCWAIAPQVSWIAVTDIGQVGWLAWLKNHFNFPLLSRLDPQRNGAVIWQANGHRLARLGRSGGGLPTALAFTPDGRYLAIGYSFGSVALWERR